MKTFRMVGMAAIAILMGVGFVSCSKDDSASGNKKLTKLVTITSSGNEVGWIFTYDADGKLNKAQFNDEWNGTTYSQTYQFHWNGNSIDVRQTDGSNDAKYTFTQENGLIRSATVTRNSYIENYTYTYFSNRIERIEVKSGPSTNFTEFAWDGDKLTKISQYYTGSSTADQTSTLTYSQTCSKGYCPLVPEIIDQHTPYNYLYMAHPELIGAQTTQLLSSTNWIDKNGNNENYNTTYEVGKDGYISKITRNGVTITLTWE